LLRASRNTSRRPSGCRRAAIRQHRRDVCGGYAALRHPPRRRDRDVLRRRWDELIDHPEPQRFRRAFALARQDDVERRARADQPGEPLASPRPGEDAELDLGEAELGLGVIGGHAIVTGKCELEAAAQARPVDPHRDGLRERRHAVQHRLAVARQLLGVGRRLEPDKILDVGAAMVVGLTEKNATARTRASRSSATSIAYTSSFTDCEMTLTGVSGLSR
jgi:hypothetical protein